MVVFVTEFIPVLIVINVDLGDVPGGLQGKDGSSDVGF